MNQIHNFTIGPGQDIRGSICDYVMSNGWKEALILGAIGSVKDMLYTSPATNELPLTIMRTPVPAAAEILSFSGEVMDKALVDPRLLKAYPEDDLPLFIHIHASAASAGSHVSGGGITSGYSLRALRVFLLPLA